MFYHYTSQACVVPILRDGALRPTIGFLSHYERHKFVWFTRSKTWEKAARVSSLKLVRGADGPELQLDLKETVKRSGGGLFRFCLTDNYPLLPLSEAIAMNVDGMLEYTREATTKLFFS